MKNEYDMRLRGLIGMLNRLLKRHGNVKVKTLQFGDFKNPSPTWLHRNGALYRWREDEDRNDTLAI